MLSDSMTEQLKRVHAKMLHVEKSDCGSHIFRTRSAIHCTRESFILLLFISI